MLLQDELKEAMEMIGEPVTEHELNNLIELADIDHDGRIDYGGNSQQLSTFLRNLYLSKSVVTR